MQQLLNFVEMEPRQAHSAFSSAIESILTAVLQFNTWQGNSSNSLNVQYFIKFPSSRNCVVYLTYWVISPRRTFAHESAPFNHDYWNIANLTIDYWYSILRARNNQFCFNYFLYKLYFKNKIKNIVVLVLKINNSFKYIYDIYRKKSCREEICAYLCGDVDAH